MSWKGYVGIELTEKEITALAHIMEVEREKVMSFARINDDGTFEIRVSRFEIERDIKNLAQDINYVERAGGDHYSFLIHYSFSTMEEAKDLLVKLVLASV